MHKCNLEFLQKLNIVDFNSAKIYREEDINPLLVRYRISYSVGVRNVSIADIIGSNNFDDSDQNIPQAMDQFFEDGGDGYHTRSIGLLSIDNDTIVSKLSKSFKDEPICVTELEDDKYFISTNGMHRFIVLKLMYLSELSSVKTEEEHVALKEKYTIPVDTEVVDREVSYAMNLISTFDVNKQIKCIFGERDNNYNSTGNLIMILSNDEEIKYTRDEFLNYMKNIDANIDYLAMYENIDSNMMNNLINSYEIIPSFKLFVSKFCPRLLEFIIEKAQVKVSSEEDVKLNDFESQEKQILNSKHFTSEQKKQLIQELYNEYNQHVLDNPEKLSREK